MFFKKILYIIKNFFQGIENKEIEMEIQKEIEKRNEKILFEHKMNFKIEKIENKKNKNQKELKILIIDDYNYIVDTIKEIIVEYFKLKKIENYIIYCGYGKNSIYEFLYNKDYNKLKFDYIFADIIFGGVYYSKEKNKILINDGIDVVYHFWKINKNLKFLFITGCVISKFSSETKKFKKYFNLNLESVSYLKIHSDKIKLLRAIFDIFENGYIIKENINNLKFCKNFEKYLNCEIKKKCYCKKTKDINNCCDNSCNSKDDEKKYIYNVLKYFLLEKKKNEIKNI